MTTLAPEGKYVAVRARRAMVKNKEARRVKDLICHFRFRGDDRGKFSIFDLSENQNI
jgi:hypothetical protein